MLERWLEFTEVPKLSELAATTLIRNSARPISRVNHTTEQIELFTSYKSRKPNIGNALGKKHNNLLLIRFMKIQVV